MQTLLREYGSEIVRKIQAGESTFMYRLSEKRSVHRVSIPAGSRPFHVIYNRNTKTVSEPPGYTDYIKVGDKVSFSYNGVRLTGEVIASVKPGESPLVVAERVLREKFGWLSRLTPRGQHSYLVIVQTKWGEKLYWPTLETLRRVNIS